MRPSLFQALEVGVGSFTFLAALTTNHEPGITVGIASLAMLYVMYAFAVPRGAGE